MSIAFSTLFPVFFLLTLGIVLRRFSWLEPQTVSQLNRVLYWIFLPSLLFYKTSALHGDLSETGLVFLAFLLGSMATLGLAGLAIWWLGLDKKKGTAFGQAAFRGNLAFIGLPIALIFAQQTGRPSSEIEGSIYLLLAPGIIFYNLVAVFVLQVGVTRHNGAIPYFKEVIKNPLILSILCGLSVGYLEINLTGVIKTFLSLTSQAVLPLALIAVGASINLERSVLTEPSSWIAAGFKVVINPINGFAVGYFLGLPPNQLQLLMILMASPTATAAFILASELGSDAKFTANVIFSSLVLDMLVYPLILSLPF